MIERASEFGASAAVPLVAGDSTHMTAGDMLREAREAHGLHIDMVAAALKVSPQKLAALEADDIASLLAQRQDWSRAQFYVRRVNNGPSANAETLWLGVKIERRLGNREAMAQLGGQLQRRFPQSREAVAYERGNFDD